MHASKYKQVPGFDQFEHSFRNHTLPVYTKGESSRPAVLIIQELPGITPDTVAFAERLYEQGYAVYMPLLMGEPNAPMQPVRNFVKACIRREFHMLATHKPSLLTDWLRSLSAQIKSRHQDRPIGAIGMCWSGGFVLSLMIDDSIIAPVMTQPGHLGLNMTERMKERWKKSLGAPQEHIEQAIARSEEEDVKILGFRFSEDAMCPKERFETMEKLFGDRFLRVDIDSSISNEHNIKPNAHCVFTLEYVHEAGHPTRQAFDTLVDFFAKQMHVPEEATITQS